MIAVIFLVACVLLLWLKRPQRPENYPPGPPTFLIFGNVFVMIESMRRRVRELLKASRERYGDIVGFVLPNGTRQVHLFTYEDIKEACFSADLTGRPSAYGFLIRSFHQPLGIGLNEGPSWEEHRLFALKQLREMGYRTGSIENIIHEEFEELFKEMLDEIDDPMKVKDRFKRTVLNVIWRFVTSSRMKRGDPQMTEILAAVNELGYVYGPQTRINFAPWLRFVAPEWSGYNAVIRHREKTISMFKSLIDEHREKPNSAEPRDFIDCFLLEMKEEDAEKRQFTELNLSVVCMDLFTAGMETPSSSLSWVILLMVMFPDVQSRVQQEIDRELGKSVVSYSDQLRMPYTEATLMEMLRRCNLVHMGVPHSATTDTVLRGFAIPKNTQVYMHLKAVHMDPEYWGDPEVFRPERFINGDGTVRRDERFIPFGVGKRFCLGDTLLRMELFIIFVSLLQKLRFSTIPGQDLTLETEFAFVNKPKVFKVKYELRH